MNIYDVFQLIGGTILAISYLPQIYKMYKVKRTDQISLWFWGLLFVGLSMMEVNALHLISLGTFSYAITESFNVALAGVFTGQIIFYRWFYKGGEKARKIKGELSDKEVV